MRSQLPFLTVLLMLVALLAGGFEGASGPAWYLTVLVGTVLFFAAGDLFARLSGRRFEAGPRRYQGGLLWTVLLVAALRVSDFSLQLEILLLSLLAAVLFCCMRPPTAGVALLTLLGIEGALALGGHQVWPVFFWKAPLILTGALAGAVLRGKGRSRFRASERSERHDRGGESTLRRAEPLRDAGCEVLFLRSLELDLEQLRHCLELTSAALLRREGAEPQVTIVAASFGCEDVLRSGLRIEGGVTAGLAPGREELWVAPARGGLGAMPYYRSADGVGGCFALRIPGETPDAPHYLLVGDRSEDASWSDRERRNVRRCARKIMVAMELGQSAVELQRERDSVRHFCTALRELNGVMELDAVFDATVKVARSILDADMVALSLAEGEGHRIVRTEGDRAADALAGRFYPAPSGLVGQALKFGKTLPARGSYPGGAPIFDEAQLFSRYRSLLVIPLREEDAPAVGALTVTSKEEGFFTREMREILELLASQVAVKIDLARTHDQLSRLARIDALTGLANRRSFEQALEKMTERSRRTGAALSLLLTDIDHFKKINDTYGHPFGDEVLKQVGAILAEEVRAVDLAARYGGEEFVLLLEGCDTQGAALLAERIRRRVEVAHFLFEGTEVRVTMSFGLAVFPLCSDVASEVLECADKALYRAKQAGRNRVETWQEVIPRGAEGSGPLREIEVVNAQDKSYN